MDIARRPAPTANYDFLSRSPVLADVLSNHGHRGSPQEFSASPSPELQARIFAGGSPFGERSSDGGDHDPSQQDEGSVSDAASALHRQQHDDAGLTADDGSLRGVASVLQNATDIAIIRRYIMNALARRDQKAGRSEHYEFVLEQVTWATADPTEFIKWLAVLTTCVSSLTEDSAEIVERVLTFDLSSAPEAAEVFVDFVLNLISSDTQFVHTCLDSLIARLASDRPFGNGEAPKDSGASGSTMLGVTGEGGETDRDTARVLATLVYERVHRLLHYILELSPTCATLFCELMVRHMPYRTRPVAQQVAYVTNLLHVAEYAPHLRSVLIGMIVDHIVKLDVEIRVEEFMNDDDDDNNEDNEDDDLTNHDDDGSATGLAGSVHGGVSDMDTDLGSHAHAEETMFALDMGGEQRGPLPPAGGVVLTAAEAEAEAALEAMRLMADALDQIMVLLFGFISDACERSDEETRDIFYTLIHIFDRCIIRTHGSKFTQFVIFAICNYDADFQDTFLDYLFRTFADPSSDAPLREACAAYISSYLARCAYLSGDVVHKAMLELLSWVHAYLDEREWEQPDLVRHRLFYMVVQGLLYVILFRIQDLESEDGSSLVGEYRLGRVVDSQLNPLLFVDEMVVDYFAKLAQQRDIMYCYTKIRENNAKVARMAPSGGRGAAKVDFFYPFDPYVLPDSRPAIDPLYKSWE